MKNNIDTRRYIFVWSVCALGFVITLIGGISRNIFLTYAGLGFIGGSALDFIITGIRTIQRKMDTLENEVKLLREALAKSNKIDKE